MKMKKYIKCYLKRQEIREGLDAHLLLFFILFFWTIPIFAIIYMIEMAFTKHFYLTEEDYYKQKLKEVNAKNE